MVNVKNLNEKLGEIGAVAGMVTYVVDVDKKDPTAFLAGYAKGSRYPTDLKMVTLKEKQPTEEEFAIQLKVISAVARLDRDYSQDFMNGQDPNEILANLKDIVYNKAKDYNEDDKNIIERSLTKLRTLPFMSNEYFDEAIADFKKLSESQPGEE